MWSFPKEPSTMARVQLTQIHLEFNQKGKADWLSKSTDEVAEELKHTQQNCVMVAHVKYPDKFKIRI